MCVSVCVCVSVCSFKKKNQPRTRWQRPSGQQWLLTYLNEERKFHQLCDVPEVKWRPRRDVNERQISAK